MDCSQNGGADGGGSTCDDESLSTLRERQLISNRQHATYPSNLSIYREIAVIVGSDNTDGMSWLESKLLCLKEEAEKFVKCLSKPTSKQTSGLIRDPVVAPRRKGAPSNLRSKSWHEMYPRRERSRSCSQVTIRSEDIADCVGKEPGRHSKVSLPKK